MRNAEGVRLRGSDQREDSAALPESPQFGVSSSNDIIHLSRYASVRWDGYQQQLRRDADCRDRYRVSGTRTDRRDREVTRLSTSSQSRSRHISNKDDRGCMPSVRSASQMPAETPRCDWGPGLSPRALFATRATAGQSSSYADPRRRTAFPSRSSQEQKKQGSSISGSSTLGLILKVVFLSSMSGEVAPNSFWVVRAKSKESMSRPLGAVRLTEVFRKEDATHSDCPSPDKQFSSTISSNTVETTNRGCLLRWRKRLRRLLLPPSLAR